jgi:hypothetical protein
VNSPFDEALALKIDLAGESEFAFRHYSTYIKYAAHAVACQKVDRNATLMLEVC